MIILGNVPVQNFDGGAVQFGMKKVVLVKDSFPNARETVRGNELLKKRTGRCARSWIGACSRKEARTGRSLRH